VFDHPTAAAVAEHLLAQVGDVAAPRSPVDDQLDRLEALLAGLDAGDERERVAGRLRALLGVASPAAPEHEAAAAAERIESASAEEIFDLIDAELGDDGPGAPGVHATEEIQ
jgi:hypothetical protein